MSHDPYYKQTLSFSLNKQNFNFNVSQELFSSHTVDIGTQRLLRTLLNIKQPTPKKILDLGCGYGPLGIVLKKQYPEAEVHFVDRDALALSYAQQNAQLNNVLGHTHFYASLGFDSISNTDFDLIVSNVPAKVGEKVLKHFLLDAQLHLAKDGVAAIVVVDEIDEEVKRTLIENENVHILLEKSWPGHHVYHYTFLTPKKQTQQSAFESGKYERVRQHFKWQNNDLQISTTFHLREFDQLGFDTRLLLQNLKNQFSTLPSITVINPGQGYIPVAVSKQCQPTKLIIIDRDLQALQTTQHNLTQTGFPAENISLHRQMYWNTGAHNVSAIVGIVQEKQNIEVYELFLEQVVAMLVEKGRLLLCSTSTTIHKLEALNKKRKYLDVITKEKNRGMSCIVFRKH